MMKNLYNYFFMMNIILTLTGCFDKNQSQNQIEAGMEAVKEEDCDEAAAQKTLEKIKTEEFSLLNQNDAGCGAEENKPKP